MTPEQMCDKIAKQLGFTSKVIEGRLCYLPPEAPLFRPLGCLFLIILVISGIGYGLIRIFG